MRIPRILVCLSLFVSIYASSGLADTVIVGSSQDNTMFSENGDTSNDLSNGAGDYFFAGATNDSAPGSLVLRRGLIAFDIAGAVPAGSSINSVTLTLYMYVSDEVPERDRGSTRGAGGLGRGHVSRQ